jgi:hypothetical protein
MHLMLVVYSELYLSISQLAKPRATMHSPTQFLQMRQRVIQIFRYLTGTQHQALLRKTDGSVMIFTSQLQVAVNLRCLSAIN